MKYLYLFSVTLLLALASQAQGVKYCSCADSSKPCDNNVIKEVCGVTGGSECTYRNDCQRECAGAILKHNGPCCDKNNPSKICGCSRPNFWCPKTWQPVCSYNGCTYANDCVRECARARWMHNGPCRCAKVPPKVCGCSRPNNCSNVWEPVCGVNQCTYANDCIRRCAGVPRYDFGPCRRWGPGPVPGPAPGPAVESEASASASSSASSSSSAVAVATATAESE